jgi:NADH-quinone oxidoreductase subunit L
MWFLENAWLVPLIPAACFLIILLFGKHVPTKGSGIGIAGVATSFVLSCGAAVQWIQHVNAAGGSEHALGGVLQSILPRAAEEGGGEHHLVVEPIIRTVTWWQSGGVDFTAGIQVDGLAVLMMFSSRCWCTCTRWST